MIEQDDLSQRIFEQPHILAIRIAANHCPPGRDHGAHIQTVWMNFCDWFTNRAMFDRELQAFVGSGKRSARQSDGR